MKLLIEFARVHPWHSLAMLLCLLVAAAAEGLGVASLMPLISMLAGPGAESAATGSEDLVAWMNAGMRGLGVEPTREAWLLALPLAFGMRAALILLARREIGYTVARVVRDLRLRLIRALLATNWSYYVEQRVGTFANAYSTEAMRASKAYLHATWVVMFAIQIVVYLAIALTISWKVTLFAAVIGTAVVAVLGPLVKLGRKAGSRQTKLFTLLLGNITDVFQSVKPLKAMARENRLGPWIEDGTKRMEKASRTQVFSREAIAALQEPIMVGMLCLGLFGMTALGLDLAAMGVMLVLVQRTLDCINRGQRRYQRVAVQESAYWSLMNTIESAESAVEDVSGGEAPTFERAIELRNVRVDYKGQPLFEDLSLEIPAGKITALAGPSGSGKTTIVDLVVGLLRPDEGDILIDGRRLAEIDLARWRQQLGYVPQEMFLLHDNIERNVTLGDPEVKREDVVRALETAHVWKEVAAMPEGLDTIVGERGSVLSGGQRQRIAIARALLHRPRLLILDEATASLDPESEAVVWAAIRELRGRTTVLAISHESALLDVADHAYRVVRGKVEPVTLPNASARAEAHGAP